MADAIGAGVSGPIVVRATPALDASAQAFGGGASVDALGPQDPSVSADTSVATQALSTASAAGAAATFPQVSTSSASQGGANAAAPIAPAVATPLADAVLQAAAAPVIATTASAASGSTPSSPVSTAPPGARPFNALSAGARASALGSAGQPQTVQTKTAQPQGADIDSAGLEADAPQISASRASASRAAASGPGGPARDGDAQAAPSSTPAAGQAQTLDAAFAAPLPTQINASAPSLTAPTAPVAAATLDDLATQTAAQVGSGASQFQITLTPEGLGQVSVTVNVGAEGKVSAAFAFERPETADALSGRASDLQKALEQAGFSLSDAGLSFAVATPAGHGQGAGSEQNPGGSGQGANQGGAGQGSTQGGSGQGGSGQGSNPGSNAAFAQTANQGSSQGDGGAQGRSWAYGQAGALAFASANDGADPSPQSSYASRAASGLDIRI